MVEAKNESSQTIAFYYGLFNNTRLAWFNGGYDTNYYKYSIGTLLVAELISYAFDHGQTIFDFLRGNESYKHKWTNEFDQNLKVYLCSKRLGNRFKMRKNYFYDTRQRVGGRHALQLLIQSFS